MQCDTEAARAASLFAASITSYVSFLAHIDCSLLGGTVPIDAIVMPSIVKHALDLTIYILSKAARLPIHILQCDLLTSERSYLFQQHTR